MKTNELRVGNYAKGLFDETVSLKAIYEDGTLAWQDGKGTTYGPMKPIKLSEGWLKSLGFKEEYKNHWRKDDFRLVVADILSEEKTGFGFPTDVMPFDEVFIEYVHQLQNIYFFIKREELD